MKALTITKVITSGSCEIIVWGYRSTSGWDVIREDLPHETQGHRASKTDAIQLALDACEPGVTARFIVKPTPVV